MDRTSCGKDISGSIDVAIMDDLAFGAGPDTNIQRKGFQDMPTVKAAFGGGVPFVNLDQGSSIPLCFILQLPHELAPSHIGDGFGEAVVLHHVLDGQTLDAYDLVLAYDLCRELVLIITPSLGNTGVYSGNLLAGLVSILGAFALPGMLALRFRQLLFIFGKEAGVAIGVTVGGVHYSGKGRDHRISRGAGIFANVRWVPSHLKAEVVYSAD